MHGKPERSEKETEGDPSYRERPVPRNRAMLMQAAELEQPGF